MKKVNAAVFIISLFFISTHVFAKEEIKWEVSEETPDAIIYSESYTYESCTISIFKDGTGININTTSGKYVQDVIIARSADGNDGVKIESLFKIVTSKNGDTTFILCEKLNDIFGDRYLNAAKELPEEVKKLFRGHYKF